MRLALSWIIYIALNVYFQRIHQMFGQYPLFIHSYAELGYFKNIQFDILGSL